MIGEGDYNTISLGLNPMTILRCFWNDCFINTKKLISNSKILPLFLADNLDAVHNIISFNKENYQLSMLKSIYHHILDEIVPKLNDENN